MKRSIPLRRTAFKRPEPKPAKQLDYTPTPRAVAVAIHDGKARMVVPLPKDVKAKHGKSAPTVAEAAWMDRISAFGCIACHIDGHPGTPSAVHHILRAGRRMGHLFTIPLCDPGHHQGGQTDGKISRHPWKARFEARYGSEMELLERTRHETTKESNGQRRIPKQEARHHDDPGRPDSAPGVFP